MTNFCSACGSELENQNAIACPNCGGEIRRGVKSFCPDCGIKLPNLNAIVCPNCGGALSGRSNTSMPTSNMQAEKNSAIAVILSVIPGLGQIYNGQIGKGILFFIVAFILLFTSWLIVPGILLAILWIVNIVDAYVTAEKINRGEPANNILNLN
jgi:TM2 domain-containing membrane protein YozV/predicted RNA-binding Zn-ribbon protein involved in translation (DUF1610 family)